MHYLSKQNSINLIHLVHIILLMYQTLTGKIAHINFPLSYDLLLGMYKSIYSSLSNRGYPSGNIPPNTASGQDMYNRYSSSQQPGNYPTGTPPNARSNSYPSAPQAHPSSVSQQTATSQPSSPSQPPSASSYSCPQDYYRQEQVIVDVRLCLLLGLINN